MSTGPKVCGAIGLAAAATAVVAALLAIWVGDGRWGATAFVMTCIALFAFIGATYPGFDR